MGVDAFNTLNAVADHNRSRHLEPKQRITDMEKSNKSNAEKQSAGTKWLIVGVLAVLVAIIALAYSVS